MNTIQVTGYLGRINPTFNTQNGPGISFTVADKTGQDDTQWWRVVCYGKTAEIVTEFMHEPEQGQKCTITVFGRAMKGEFKKQDGTIEKTTEIIANHVTFEYSMKKTNSAAPATAYAGTADAQDLKDRAAAAKAANTTAPFETQEDNPFQESKKTDRSDFPF